MIGSALTSVVRGARLAAMGARAGSGLHCLLLVVGDTCTFTAAASRWQREPRRGRDGLDRVVRETVQTNSADGNLVTVTRYDGLGNKVSVTDPRNGETAYDYDELGRLWHMKDALQKEASYDNDEGGLRISETDRRGIEKAMGYDNLGRLLSTSIAASSLGPGWRQETDYQDRQLRRVEHDALNHTTTFVLDEMGRVKSEVDALNRAADYGYDGVNRRSATDRRGNTTSYDYDAANRLTKTTDPRRWTARRSR